MANEFVGKLQFNLSTLVKTKQSFIKKQKRGSCLHFGGHTSFEGHITLINSTYF